MKIEVTISDDQLDALADKIADRLVRRSNGMPENGRPLTQKETAQALGISHATVCRRIKAGVIRTVPGLNNRIPQAEIDRLTLNRPGDITSDGITVPASNAKTKRRRFIHMPAPLAEWLKVYPVGDAVTPANWERKEKAVRRLAGWKVWSDLVSTLKLNPVLPADPPEDAPEWPQNALRHTAASVALAMGKPLETLIFEHGHAGGVEMLRRHYIGRMPKGEALKIWTLGPKEKKLTRLKSA